LTHTVFLIYISSTAITNYKQWQIAVIAMHSLNEASFCGFQNIITLLVTNTFMNAVIWYVQLVAQILAAPIWWSIFWQVSCWEI